MKKNVKSEIKKLYPKRIREILNLISTTAEEKKVKVFLVGGMVRDLLLGNPSIDLDIAVDGISGIELAKTLSKKLKAKFKSYEKFYTASIELKEDLKVDIATCRKEIYPTPGDLPSVERASIKEDLYRRDFTINAIAINLNKERFGDIVDYYGGVKDLRAKIIRIIHKNSFKDDPTRILRGIRFATRLNFDFEPQTEKLIIKAVNEKRFKTVSKDRIREELKLILKEEECYEQIKNLNKYVGLSFIHPDLNINSISPKLFCKAKDHFFNFLRKYKSKNNHGITEDDIWIVNLIILMEALKLAKVKDISQKYNFSNKIKNKIIKYKESELNINKLLEKAKEMPPSEIFQILNSLPLESIFVILAKAEHIDIVGKIWSFLTNYRFIDVHINGNDLKKMGIKPGPEFSNILTQLLHAKIDGKVKTKQEELEFVKNIIRHGGETQG